MGCNMLLTKRTIIITILMIKHTHAYYKNYRKLILPSLIQTHVIIVWSKQNLLVNLSDQYEVDSHENEITINLKIIQK